MKDMGFKRLLADSEDSIIITSYMMPLDSNFDFSQFYSMLSNKGKNVN